MIKVKITHPYGNWPLARQTPNNSGIWNNHQFFINDDIQECDYWFVFDDLLQEETALCYSENVIIITLEFPAIRPIINLNFLKQFNTVLKYSREINHPDAIDILSPFPWHIGVDNTNSETTTTNYRTYDDFKMQPVLSKSKLISVISSNKEYIEGHKKRLEFVKILKKHFGQRIDVFGRGINDFADKWDVISPYKYHISLENSSCENGISEKLYDSFLGQAFPFYYGCPNTDVYFPTKSFVQIDINNVNKTLDIIDSSISNQLYEKNIQYILEAKKLVLDKYNVFNLMTKYCINSSSKKSVQKNLITLKPESYFTMKPLKRVKTFLKKITWRKF